MTISPSVDHRPTSKSIDVPPGLIFDIQGHSVHDGPGTRTTVFLMGCPLECVWCCNPEGLFTKPVVRRLEKRCVCCGHCIETCSKGAVSIVNDQPCMDRSKCDTCTTHECVETCYHEALEVIGRYYTVDGIMAVLDRDRPFWGSKGGVTFSGGEPLKQREFLMAVLRRCREARIHVTVETTSCVPTPFYLQAMQYIGWVFTDIKHMDSRVHRRLTGVGNELILKNIKRLALMEDWEGVMLPRIPIIPGLNDQDDNVRRTAQFLVECELDAINLLPFHRLGESKYRQLGRRYEFEDVKPPSTEQMENLAGICRDEGLLCFVGWDTPF